MIHEHVDFGSPEQEQALMGALATVDGAAEALTAHLRARAADGQTITLCPPGAFSLESFLNGTHSQLLLDQLIRFPGGSTMAGGVLLQRTSKVTVSSHT